MSRALVLGDPSSLSQLATDALGAARDLDQRADALDGLLARLRDRRTTRVERDLARRLRTLLDATRESARTLDTLGIHLQSHAADLAPLRAQSGRVKDDIAAAGLVLEEGRVVLPWGITGVAAPGEDLRREADRQRLQDALDDVTRLAERRRSTLTAALDDAGAAWARIGAILTA